MPARQRRALRACGKHIPLSVRKTLKARLQSLHQDGEARKKKERKKEEKRRKKRRKKKHESPQKCSTDLQLSLETRYYAIFALHSISQRRFRRLQRHP